MNTDKHRFRDRVGAAKIPVFICVHLCLPAAPFPAFASNSFVIAADARPRVEAGKLVTDAIDDVTFQLIQNVRTFGWQFQSIPGDPYFLQDPGFNATSSSGLPAGSLLGFNVTRGLSFWNGDSRVSFASAPADESLVMNFGGGTVTISSTTTAQNGFNFVSIAANGAAHRHLNSFLNNGAVPLPSSGVYLTSIRLTNNAGPAPGDALFLAFNNGAPQADFDRALSYVANPFTGDADFSGTTDIADFATVAANFNRTAEQFWYDGDFNDDYAVDIADFSLLAASFNRSAPLGLPRADPGLIATIPEPVLTSLFLLLLPAANRFRRRR